MSVWLHVYIPVRSKYCEWSPNGNESWPQGNGALKLTLGKFQAYSAGVFLYLRIYVPVIGESRACITIIL